MLKVLVSSLLCLILASCGGGGSSVNTGSQVVALKRVTLVFNTNNVDSSAPLGLIELTVKQPIGVNVSSASCTLSSLNSIGSAVYSDDTRTLTFKIITTTENAIPVGEFAKLICDMTPSSALSVNDFQTEQIITNKDLVGYNNGTVSLTNLIQLSTTVSFK